MLTKAQHDALVALKQALHDAEAALPGETILKALHGAMSLAVLAGKSRMTDSQFRALGGGTDKDGE